MWETVETDLESDANLAAEGDFTYNDRETIYINLTAPKKGRYVKLVAVSPKTDGSGMGNGGRSKDVQQSSRYSRCKCHDQIQRDDSGRQQS